MITGKRSLNLRAELTDGRHSWTADVDKALGGDDVGANPHELLEAALAACTVITCQMYADRKGWKLESTDVEVKTISEGKDSVIGLKVAFRGDLTDEQRERLLDISKRCPIHKLLESNVTIQTSL